ncbi:MAG TPA: tautomerase family protein [Candidatus Enterocloster faecavium]|uniref:Tautomerase family protein n=1 Tax=Candidatus Enterocloster faecavium TaxID=2838560 RepID=A0A9D2L6P2_9FIRM|nr:tautomerase family protein [Candidatus Enterocloster faecavium]
MPVMCTVRLPKGKKQETIEKTLVDISNVLMENFDMQPNQVRVTIDELPKNRYSAGGVMAYEMPEFNEEE